MKSKFRLLFTPSITISLLSALVLILIAVITWGASRSMGFADEGLYLLAARFPEEIRQNVSAIYIYTGYLFKLVGYDIAFFRIAGMTLIVLSALIFWCGYDSLFQVYFDKLSTAVNVRWTSLLFLQIGALLYYQWSLATPSYYTLIAVAENMFGGLVLLGLSLSAREGKAQWGAVCFLLAGLVTGCAFFIKFPAGVCFAALAAIVVGGWTRLSLAKRLLGMTCLCAGFFLWAAGYFCFVHPPGEAWRLFHQGWDLFQTLGKHSPGDKLFVYPKDLLLFVGSGVYYYWYCYVLLIGLFVVSQYRRHALSGTVCRNVIGMVLLAALALFIWQALFGANWQKNFVGNLELTKLYLTIHLGLILLLFALHYLLKRMQQAGANAMPYSSYELTLLMGFFMALPLAASVGTSNPLYNVVLYYAAPWFGVLILMIALLIFRVGLNPVCFNIGLFVLSACCANQIIKGNIFAPAQLINPDTNMIDQSFPTNVGFPARPIMLDLQTHELIEKLAALAKTAGFQPGDDIIAVSFMPGLVYALGGRSPGHPTFLVWDKHFLAYSKIALQFSDSERRKKAFVLTNRDLTAEFLNDLLTSGGLDFPSGYKKVGTVAGFGSVYTFYAPISHP